MARTIKRSLIVALLACQVVSAALTLPSFTSGQTYELIDGYYGPLVLEGLSDVTIEADEGSVVLVDRITMKNCQKVKIVGLKVQHPTPSTLFADDGKRHYDVLGDVVAMTDCHLCTIDGCTLTGWNKYVSLSGVYLYDCSSISISNCEISTVVRGVMAVASPMCNIYHNYIHDMSEGSGIRLNTSCEESMVSSNHVTGQRGTAVDPYFPDSDATAWHPGSGISIRSSNVTVRNNIVHDGFSQGLMYYLDAGIAFSDMVLENCLFYDTGRVYLYNCGNNVLVRNNTIVAGVRKDGTAKYDILQRFDVIAFGWKPHADYDGSGVSLFNNIFVDNWYIPGTDQPYTEDYNTWWQHGYSGGTKGSHSTLAVWRDGTSPYALRGNPNYFGDIGYRGSTPEYSYEKDGAPAHFVNPGMFTYGSGPDCGTVWDYHLAPGSPSINSGSSAHQPSDSLGSLGEDGFIAFDGPARDAAHHSRGAYEVGESTEPDPVDPDPVDPNEPTEITVEQALDVLRAHPEALAGLAADGTLCELLGHCWSVHGCLQRQCTLCGIVQKRTFTDWEVVP